MKNNKTDNDKLQDKESIQQQIKGQIQELESKTELFDENAQDDKLEQSQEAENHMENENDNENENITKNKKKRQKKTKEQEQEQEHIEEEINIEKGLTSEQVENRIKKGLVNKQANKTSRSVKKIFASNIFTFFNLINIILAALLFYVRSYENMLFMMIVVINTIIGIIQELRAKNTLDKLSLFVKAKTAVMRNGNQLNINAENIVKDDITILLAGNQIYSDSILVQGMIEVNESLLTGESDTVVKNQGDMLYSGSFVVSGKAYAKVENVGVDNFAHKITAQAKSMKKHGSELRKAMNRILKVVSMIILPLGTAMFATRFYHLDYTFTESIIQTVGALVGMIPEGLILLTSIALAMGAVNLGKHKVLVHELFCIETLARVDMLCLDKTGTITEGKMKVNEVIKITDVPLEEVLGNIVYVLSDYSSTFEALKSHFLPYTNYTALSTIPFSSARKYSGVSFEKQGTYLLGAFDALFPHDNVWADEFFEIRKQTEQYTKEGIRVIALAHSPHMADISALPQDLKPCALILISDIIRKNALDTINYFKEQDVELTVISGDHPATVSYIAEKAGVENADKYIDATIINSDDEIASAVNEYRVFGRVTPDKKKKIIKALQNKGHTVAMTGDGVNDVPALKQANCSIAMAAGSDAAKGCSDMVLLKSDFSAMPHVVNQGRRVINNIQSSSSLFLIKTIFSVIVTLITLITGMSYPFMPLHLTIISAFAIGIPTFIFSIEPNFKRVKEGFLRNVALNAATGAAVVVFHIILIAVMSSILGLSDVVYSTLCVITTGVTSLYMIKQVFPLQTILRKTIYVLVFALFFASMIFLKDILVYIGVTNLSIDFARLPYKVMMVMLVQILITPSMILIINNFLQSILKGYNKAFTKKKNKK